MKIVVENYNSLLSSQASYIDASLRSIGVNSFLWDTNIYSLFDVLDLNKPDFVVMSWKSKFLNDAIKYVTNKNIDLVVNITHAPQQVVKAFDAVNNCRVLFNSSILMEPYASTKKIVTIYPGADLFLPSVESIKFNIEAAICAEQKSEIFDRECDKYKCYHKLCFNEAQNNEFDSNVNVFNAANLYRNYDKILFCGSLDFIFSQAFFDSILRCKKVMIRGEDKAAASKILWELFSNIAEVEESKIPEAIRFGTQQNHTCFNRVAELMSAMKCNEQASLLLKKVSNGN